MSFFDNDTGDLEDYPDPDDFMECVNERRYLRRGRFYAIGSPPTQIAFLEQREEPRGPYDGGERVPKGKLPKGMIMGDLRLVRRPAPITTLAAYLMEMDWYFTCHGTKEYDPAQDTLLFIEAFAWEFDPFDDEELERNVAKWRSKMKTIERQKKATEETDPLMLFYQLQDRLEREAILRKLNVVLAGVLKRLYWNGDGDSRHKKYKRCSKSAKAREIGWKLRRMKRRRQAALAKLRERMHEPSRHLHIVVHDSFDGADEKSVPHDLVRDLEREFLSVA